MTEQRTGLYGALLTGLAMLAFAANSVLCRMALGDDLIDPASFTSVRVSSGALCLVAIILVRDRQWRPSRPHWLSIFSLFSYMAFFSFAYRALSAGTGALLLFGFVQLTMIGVALSRGDRFSPIAWAGLMLAIGGMVYLVMPGVEAPDISHSILMGAAGIAWGIYSLLGKNSRNPTIDTATNFLYAIPLVSLISIISHQNLFISSRGLIVAVVAGVVTSGFGYAIWYRALRGIKATSAATVQLSVPALATLGGVLFLSEPLSLRISIAIIVTISGIAIVLNQPIRKV